jgi:hypothetical protein
VRRSIHSPIEKKKAEEVGQGMQRRRPILQSALTVCKTLDFVGYIDTLSSTAPASLRPQPLHDTTMQEQKAALLDNLLYVFMGYEGQYIRFVEAYSPVEEKIRPVGPEFRISLGLDPSARDLTTSMLKMAAHYYAMEAFVETQSREEFGCQLRPMCHHLKLAERLPDPSSTIRNEDHTRRVVHLTSDASAGHS